MTTSHNISDAILPPDISLKAFEGDTEGVLITAHTYSI